MLQKLKQEHFELDDPVLTLGILSESIADPREALGAVGRITFSAPPREYLLSGT